MRRSARAAVAAMAAVVMTPLVAYAEPMVLTASQMESITAAAPPAGINININITTQVANARAIAIATCGICVDGVPSASSFAAAINANVSGQQILR